VATVAVRNIVAAAHWSVYFNANAIFLSIFWFAFVAAQNNGTKAEE